MVEEESKSGCGGCVSNSHEKATAFAKFKILV